MALITEQRQAQRAKEIANALASVRMEGLEPSEGAMALFQSYSDGDLTTEQFEKAFDEYIDRKYGPVRISRNKRP